MSPDAAIEARFERNGFLVVPAAVGADELAGIRDHLDGFEVPGNGQVAVSLDHDPTAAALASHPSLVGLARSLLGGDCETFGFTYLVKPPRSPLVVLWHQDGHPWHQRGILDAVTVWVALDDAGADSGGLRVMPGSHRLPLHPLRPNNAVANMFGWESPAEIVEEADAIDLVLRPGDVSVHHPALLHSSGPNRTDRRRAALGLRYRRRS